jgi:hypothetical protein
MARRSRDAGDSIAPSSSSSSSSSSSTLAKLARFKHTLQAIPATSSSSPSAKPDVVTAASSLLRDDDGEDGRGGGDVSWMRHRLRFERRPQDWKKEDDELLVLDPMGLEGARDNSASRRGRRGGRGGGRAGRAEQSSVGRRREEHEDDGLMPVLQAELDARR